MEKRDQFLLHLYDNLWDSIDRSELGVWQFVGLNAALFTIIALIYTEKLSTEVAGAFGMIIVFWGMNIVINAGWWFNHNLNIIRNIEREFFDPADYGRILPEGYKQHKVQALNALNRIHLVAFGLLGIGLILATKGEWFVILLGAIGLVATAAHLATSKRRLGEFAAGTGAA